MCSFGRLTAASDIAGLHAHLGGLVTAARPELTAIRSVGVETAAQLPRPTCS